MKLIRMEDEVWQVFNRWLEDQAYPSEHNYPGTRQAFKEISEASDADATAMLTDACQYFRLMAEDVKKLMHTCQEDNTRLVLENRELLGKITGLTVALNHVDDREEKA